MNDSVVSIKIKQVPARQRLAGPAAFIYRAGEPLHRVLGSLDLSLPRFFFRHEATALLNGDSRGIILTLPAGREDLLPLPRPPLLVPTGAGRKIDANI